MLKRSYKNLVPILLSAALTATTLVGCGSTDTSSAGSTTTPEATASESAAVSSTVANSNGLPISSEPITLSIFLPSRQPDALYTNDTLTFKELEKRTNIKFDINTVVSSQVKDKFTIMMASGNLPDIVYGTVENINKYGIQGAFQDLDDLIEKNAPNIKKYLVDNSAVHAQAAATDGKLYSVPMLSAIKTAMGYNIRQDWLDKLNLKAPGTIDEWHTVLKAFKEKDPNGNGKQDEVPLILDRAWENYYLNFADAWKIDVDPNKDYWMYKDGKATFTAIQPEFKEFISTMGQWYKEGLIDKEFATREDTNNYHMLNNLAGATCYWTGYVAAQNTNAEILAKEPKTNWQVIAPPVLKAGDEAKTYSQQLEVVPHSWAISSSNKHIDETIKLFDYVYGDEGSLLFNFGIADDTYKMENGKPVYTDKVKKDKDGATIFLRKNGIQPLIGIRQMPEYESASCANDDTRKQLFDYVDNNRFFETAPKPSLTDAEKTLYDTKMVAIKTYVEEMLLKFMVGSEDPNQKWDEYVAKVKELGIDDITGVMDKAYSRYYSIAK